MSTRLPGTIGLSILTRQFLEAEGTYEVIRVHRGKPFRLDDHLDRVMRAAQRLGIPFPAPREAVVAQIESTIAASTLTEAFIYVLVVTHVDGLEGTRTDGSRAPFIVMSLQPYVPKPAAWYTEGIHVTAQRFIRTTPEIKDLSKHAEKRALRDAPGFDDVLIENAQGHITESTQCNVFIVQDGTLITPAEGFLPGVTRHVLLEFAHELLPVQLAPLTRDRIAHADECFLTGTLHDIVPVTRYDHAPIGTGKVGPWTKQLMERFTRAFEEVPRKRSC